MRNKFAVAPVVVLMASILLVACSTTPSEYKGVYKNTEKERTLEVPPDLSIPDNQGALHIPQLASQQGQGRSATGVLAPTQFGSARLVKQGGMRWLELSMPIDDLWFKSQQFFKKLGFNIKSEDKALGVFETDYLENRIDVPGNWVSSFLSNLFSSGVLDKYRVRLERAEDGQSSLVFIAHSGLKEVITGGDGLDSTVVTEGWEFRAPDPELEVEMLQRLAIYLGGDKAKLQEQAKAIESQPEFANLVKEDGLVALRVNEGFARGWRRIGLGLDRLGVLIEDRNRSQGTYFIRLPETMFKEEQGIFAGLFSDKKAIADEQYLLRVIEKNGQSLVAMFDKQGQPVANELAERLLMQLKAHLI